jgi:hypothetical protein
MEFSRKPTYLKMDLEGMELKALIGGENLLKKYRPKLAISVYHNFDDLRKIFLYLSFVYVSFSLYLRHYTEGIDETILYIVPD